MKPTIIFTTRILEYPPIGGPRLRIANSIIALSQIADLVIHSRASYEQIGGEKAVNFFRQYVKEVVFAPSVDSLRKPKFRGIFLVIADFRDLVRVAQNFNTQIIWLGYGNISYGLCFFLKLFTNFKVVVDTDSVWSRFVLRSLPYQKTLRDKLQMWYRGYKKRLQEFWGTKLADVTTAVSEFDAQYYRALTGNSKKVAVFSNVIDLKNYQNKLANPEIKHPSIYLAGSFGPGSAMEVAATWVIREIIPLVWKKNPTVHFYLVGRGATEKLYQLKNDRITITGKIDSVLPYLGNVDVVLVPLKFESGTRFKILEAAACKVPIVSTSLGAEGLEVRPGKNILIADTPEDFAEAIVKLVTNKKLSQEISENAYREIAMQYNIPRAIAEAQKILNLLQAS